MQRKHKTKRKISPRHKHRSWDESSDPESFEMEHSSRRNPSPRQNIIVSNLTGNIMSSESVVLNIEDATEEESSSSNDTDGEGEGEEEEIDDGNDEGEEEEELHHNDWEIRMLAAEMKKRESVSDFRSEIDQSDGLLRRRKKKSESDTASEPEATGSARPRASSLDPHNLRQQYKCRGVFKAMSFERDKDQL